MRLLVLTGGYDIVSGGQVWLRETTKRLARSTHNKIMVVTITKNKASERYEVTQDNVTIKRIYIPPLPRIPLLNQTMFIVLRETMITILSILPLTRIIRGFHPDVFSVDANVFAAISAFLSSRLARTKVIVGAYGILRREYLVGSYGRFTGAFLHHMQRLILLLPYDKIVTPSTDIRDIMVGMGVKEDKVAVIPHGVDIEKFKPLSSPKRGQEVSVGYAGRLILGKGVNYLIRAMQQVSREFPSTRLSIVGEGECRAELETLSQELGISDKVAFVPQVKPEDMPDLIQDLDILVLPSLSEVMPLIMLETMACGKVFIGTRVGGIPDIIENYVDGIVVEPNDADALAKAIINVLSDNTLRESIARKARKKAESYSWDTIVPKLEGLYLQVSGIDSPTPIIAKLINYLLRKPEVEWRRVILSLLDKNPDAKLLDFGCGDGEFTMKVAEKIGTRKIYGVDIISECLDKAKARGIEVHQCDLNDRLPFESGCFDVVHANQIIEHLSNTDMPMREMYRVLRTGGYLTISTPNLASFHNILYLLWGKQPYWASVSDEVLVGTWHPTSSAREKARQGTNELAPDHRRLFTPGALKGLLEYHGFEVEKNINSGFYPLPTPLAKVMCFIDKRHAAIIIMKARKK